MNERIKELAEQAGGEFYTGFAGSPNSVKFMEQDFEKFAELIVAECSRVCLTQRDPWNTNYKPSVKFSEAIKYHFGVK
jgi:hypothetical protein